VNIIPGGGVFKNFTLESPDDLFNTEVEGHLYSLNICNNLRQGLEPKPNDLFWNPKTY